MAEDAGMSGWDELATRMADPEVQARLAASRALDRHRDTVHPAGDHQCL